MTMDEEKAVGMLTTNAYSEKTDGSGAGSGGDGLLKASDDKKTAAGLKVVEGNEYVQHGGDDMNGPARRGHVCCGCCCDTRKAVIVVNVINISLALLGIASLSVIASGKFASQVRYRRQAGQFIVHVCACGCRR
jgi:hypothetical protein